ncbi:transposase [Anaerocolumna aminovalerica]|nr:transposase [Anaerocolumna aminovalerica]
MKYITRYLGRPVIAASRIDKYDGERVTFHYNRHEDGVLVTETVPALDFIKRLIIHIPEKHFKMLRYYEIYAKHHKQEKISGNAFPMRNVDSYVPYLIGNNPFF